MTLGHNGIVTESTPAMRRAIEYLVGRGLLVRKRGIGTRVVHAKVTREVDLTSLYDVYRASRYRFDLTLTCW